ncbi:hypothetical protein SJI45_19655 [Streptomyces sp. S399]|uniref:hypothetical protein n=1 Tax=Streptomyces sp. S399 TaxID=3096009 RepID=UPI002A7F245C|nr:hypothetical protein [Streptomyces sp. S399]WPR54893.1 hypothetical protein SJI45_19655 [Streptomyces sp. S399]
MSRGPQQAQPTTCPSAPTATRSHSPAARPAAKRSSRSAASRSTLIASRYAPGITPAYAARHPATRTADTAAAGFPAISLTHVIPAL